MHLLTPRTPAEPGEGAEGTVWLQQLCLRSRRTGHGGVSVPSCAQAQRVYGAAELGEMLLIRRSPPWLCKEGRRFSTSINLLSMTLTWREHIER